MLKWYFHKWYENTANMMIMPAKKSVKFTKNVPYAFDN